MKGSRGALIDHKVHSNLHKKHIYINGVKQGVRNLCGNVNAIPHLPKQMVQSEDGPFYWFMVGNASDTLRTAAEQEWTPYL